MLSQLNTMAQGSLNRTQVGMQPCAKSPQPCQWKGVICSSGHVTHLSFYGQGLSGEIPAELADLSELKVLMLDNNQLSGEIPPELGNLSQLQELDLSGNYFSGEIPPELANLSQLTILDLGNNQLSGDIPPELGNLVLLKVLTLDNNQLSGGVPTELGNLSQLELLALDNNPLRGPLPPGMAQSSLIMIHLSNTELCIPATNEFKLRMGEVWDRDYVDAPYCK